MENKATIQKRNAKILSDLLKEGGRLQSLDCIRGLAVCLMVGHHFFFDLVEFAGAPPALFSNPVFNVLHIVFSSCFLILSGISCRLCDINYERGLFALGAAICITIVTFTMDAIAPMRTLIAFGVLHLLACGMLLFAGAHKWIDKIPRKVQPVLYISLILITWKFCYCKIVGVKWLFPLGLISSDFYWTDYYPLLPWIFVYLIGTWLGLYLVEGRFPSIFYTFRFKPLAWIGSHALVVYLVHQPILFAATQIIILIMGGN